MQKLFADIDRSPNPVVTNEITPEDWRLIIKGLIEIERSIEACEAERKSRGGTR